MATAAEIIVTVRAKVEQFKQSMKEATDSIGASTQGVEQRAEAAGNSFTKGFAKVAGKLSGFNISTILLNGVKDATEALNTGQGFRSMVDGFAKSVQQSLFAIPIAGQIAKITDNLINGSARAARAAFDSVSDQFEQAAKKIGGRIDSIMNDLKDIDTQIREMQEDAAAAAAGPEAVAKLAAERRVKAVTGGARRDIDLAEREAIANLRRFDEARPVQEARIKEDFDLDDAALTTFAKTVVSLGTNFLSDRKEAGMMELQTLQTTREGLELNLKTVQAARAALDKKETELRRLGQQISAASTTQSPAGADVPTVEEAVAQAEATSSPMEAVTTGLAEGTQRGGDYDWNNVERLVTITSDMKRIQTEISKALKKYAPPN